MSTLELLAPEAADAVPFSVRLAERLLKSRAALAPSDRRTHQRRGISDLDWLRAVRLLGGTGYDVRLVDLSEGGALLEVDAPLKPGTALTLELSGPGLDAAVPLEVLRCYISNLRGATATYRGACAFAHHIDLPGARVRAAAAAAHIIGNEDALAANAAIERAAASAHQIVAAPKPAPAIDSKFQKIVVRHANGQIVKGYTQDFHPSRPQFSVWPSINATPKERVIAQVARLKAVFFVRDFNGNPGYREQKSGGVRGQGRRIEITFADGEVVVGTTLSYRPDGQGFFLNPADAGANNTRIFVVTTALRRVRFL